MRPSRRRRCPQRTWGFESIEPRILLSADGPADFRLDYLVDHSLDDASIASVGDVSALIGLSQARANYGFTGQGQTVVVIDSGIDYNHVALGGGFGSSYHVVGGYDFAENDADPNDDGPSGSHGTHVAGILASTDSNNPGIAPGVDLVSLRVFNDQGDGYFQWVEQALQWVHQNRNSFANPITTVNLSLGGEWNSDSLPAWATLEDELAQLDADGIFVAVAAGNSFDAYKQPGLDYPAASPYVVPVSSVDDSGSLSYFSQRDARAIAAPGRAILSTVPDYMGNQNGVDDDFVRYSGTSMAAPYVAGAAVLLREAYQFAGHANVDQTTIYDLMVSTSDTIYDSQTGQSYHRLNLQRAIDTIMVPDDFGSTAAAAYQLGSIADTRSVWGTIGRLDDRDWFSFVAGRTGTATFTVKATEELVAQWEPGSGGTGAIVRSDNTLSLNVVAGQTYTVGLSTRGGLGHYTIVASLGPAAQDRNYWGTISQGTYQDYRIDTSGQWFTMTAAADGILSLQASFSSRAGNVDLQLLDAAGKVVGGSYGSGDVERIDVAATAGQTFRLHAYVYGSGANPDVNFQAANLVSTSGSTLRVRGTGGDDQFAVSSDDTSYYVTVNGLDYQFDRTEISSIVLDGLGGNDTADVQGTRGADVAVLRPGSAELSGEGYRVQVDNVEQITMQGGGGSDVARFYDSAGDDTLVATDHEARLSGPGFDNRADGFTVVHAYAGAGGSDSARLYDSPGNDTLLAAPTYAVLYGPGFYIRAKSFSRVDAFSTGGKDTARFYDSAGDDTFVGAPTYSMLSGDGFCNRAEHFGTVQAFASAGRDIARLIASPGQATAVIAAAYADLSGDGFFVRAKSFDQVYSDSNNGGSDHTIDFGSVGDDRLLAAAHQAVFSGDQGSSGLYGPEYIAPTPPRPVTREAEAAAVDSILEADL